MTGRHRQRSRTWGPPAAIATGATAVLVSAGWLAGNLGEETTGQAAAAMTMPTPSSTTTAPPSTTTTPPPPAPPTTTVPTTTSKKPTSTTTQPKPTTTTQQPTSSAEELSEGAACSTSLSGAKPHVAQVGNHVKNKFDIDTVGGKAGRSGTSDHPSGLALDFMVDSSTGDDVAQYVLDNQDKFGVKYVIWEQRYNAGSGWSTMEDRGGATANHMDHVHVSFDSGADVDVSC